MSNDMVTIKLDRVRVLRFGHKALKMIEKLTGKEADDINALQMEEIEKVFYCGLLADAIEHGEELKLEDMEDLLDKADPYSEVLEKLEQAMNAAYGKMEKAETKNFIAAQKK